MSSLAGHVAVVTGGSRGIGRATVELFLRAGARVAFCARGAADIHSTVQALSSVGEVFGAVCDVTDSIAVKRFCADVGAKFGTPSLLVNNAGNVLRRPLAEIEDSEWHNVIATNLDATFYFCRELLPLMRKARRGRIINIASIAGQQGTPLLSAYCAAKHGVIGLTRALAIECRGDNIQVNAICPGSVDTAMLQEGMPGGEPDMTPEEIAGAALYLAADAPAAMAGQCIDIYFQRD